MSKFEIGEAETITRQHAGLRNQVNSENQKKPVLICSISTAASGAVVARLGGIKVMELGTDASGGSGRVEASAGTWLLCTLAETFSVLQGRGVDNM
jgi:hypothetical protein